MSKTEIEIKLLADCTQHIPNLAKLQFEEISKHWIPHASLEGATQRLIEHCNKDNLPLTFVALQNDLPIGMASLRKTDGLLCDFFPWLGSVVVDPNHRKDKVGEKLIEVIKQQAADFGYDKLYLFAFDPTIPNWYKKLGWELIGTDYRFNHPISIMQITL